jgi:hypothetical protein
VPTAESSLQARNGASKGRVRLVSPSEWALLDCRKVPIFESIAGERTGIRALPGFKLLFSDIDETPIVRNRRPIFDNLNQSFSASSQKPRIPGGANSYTSEVWRHLFQSLFFILRMLGQ